MAVWRHTCPPPSVRACACACGWPSVTTQECARQLTPGVWPCFRGAPCQGVGQSPVSCPECAGAGGAGGMVSVCSPAPGLAVVCAAVPACRVHEGVHGQMCVGRWPRVCLCDPVCVPATGSRAVCERVGQSPVCVRTRAREKAWLSAWPAGRDSVSAPDGASVPVSLRPSERGSPAERVRACPARLPAPSRGPPPPARPLPRGGPSGRL